jgi:short-subunit dehydrogenase
MDSKQYGPWAFIAGGSEGVGTAFARKLAAKGINLVLAARKPGPLEDTASLVRKESKVEVRTLPLDLTAPDMLDRVKAVTKDVEVGMLICNAGADSIFKHFHDRGLDDAMKMIALNVTGPTQLTYHFGKGMRERKRGGIILVGSMAAYVGQPRTAVYGGVKAYQTILAEGLWYEMKPHNVHVLELVLGVTRTPAMARMGLNMDVPGFAPAEPDDVAQEGLDHLGKEPVWNAAGNDTIVQHMRGMNRAEIVTMIAKSAEALG